MSNPKRHHFVPEAYLNGFVEDETQFLNIYSKSSGVWRRQSPKKVMRRNKYYLQNWAPAGVDKNILEKKLGAEFEPNGLTALNKLIRDPENLNETDTANILIYLQFQRIRVPRQADMAKSIAKAAIEKEIIRTEEGQSALKRGEIIVKDSFRIQFMRETIGLLSPYFSRMIWKLIEAEPHSSFITSDSPVSFYNVDFLPPTEAGAGLYGTTVLFPISKRFLLVMHHPEYLSGEKRASEVLPKESPVEDGLIEIQKDIVWDQDAVQSQNWLMLQLSQDLVVGESKAVLENAVGRKLAGHR